MASPSFGRGYPSRNPNIVTLVRKDGLRLPIHKEIKDLVAILMDLTEMYKYNINPNQTWGYANRAISGTNAPSNHSWGTAVDINAPSNPYGSAAWHRRNARGTKPFGLQLVCNIPQKVIQMWESQQFGWGGRYQSKPDPMHFEFKGSVDDARRLTRNLKSYLGGGSKSSAKPSQPVLKLGSKGEAVKRLQRLIGQVKVDGDFGPATKKRVESVQGYFGLKPDGIVGPKTWNLLNYLNAHK